MYRAQAKVGLRARFHVQVSQTRLGRPRATKSRQRMETDVADGSTFIRYIRYAEGNPLPILTGTPPHANTTDTPRSLTRAGRGSWPAR
jgi:hypothetical protein